MGEIQGVRWDMSGFFPEFNGPEMLRFKKRLAADIAGLARLAPANKPVSPASAAVWERIILGLESAEMRMSHVNFYVCALSWADSSREEYSSELAKLSRLEAELSKLRGRVAQSFGKTPERTFRAFLSREKLREIAHHLRRMRRQAMISMSQEEEALAADLSADGFQAWDRLYGRISAGLTFEMAWPGGKTERLPISRWRALISDPDREVGSAAFVGGSKAWASIEDPCAAALNAMAGWRLTLAARRGSRHFLDQPLLFSGITRGTLDAMYAAIDRNIEKVREILRVKAAALGKEGISFHEREALLPIKGAKNYSWPEAVSMVDKAFSGVYPGLGAFFRDFLRRRHIDSEPRRNKTPGAFCVSSRVAGESRVIISFNGSMHDIGTMAHEVGHAWHGNLSKGIRWMATKCPPTLSEAASVFGEHILLEGLLSDGGLSETEKLLVLDDYLNTAAVFLLDMSVRFRFETAFYEERRRGEVPLSRLKELMSATQREVYGSALAPGGEDPLFWASKLHFYMSGYPFYNYPYTFGFLTARALFEKFRKEGAAFIPKFEEFLRLAGADSVENVVRKTLGSDISKPEFWAQGISGIELQLAEYKRLLEKRRTQP